MTVLTLSAFSCLTKGLTLEQIIARLGLPDRQRDTGSALLQYRLNDGSRVDVLYATPKTLKCIHYRADGTKMTWIPN